MTWYILTHGEKDGPFTDADIGQKIQAGTLKADDLVWREGFVEWVPVNLVPGLLTPPPLPDDANDSHPGSPAEHHSEAHPPEPDPSHAAPQPTSTPKPALTAAKGSYFARHWRGDLSLAQSYWVNGTILTIVATIIINLLSTAFDPTNRPTAFSLTMIGMWAALLVITVWQLVGIWRSAGKHPQRNGSKVWATIAKIMVVIGWLQLFGVYAGKGIPQISEYWKIATQQDDIGGKYQLRVLRDATELEISGPMGFGLTNDVQKILDAQPTIRLIHLNSPGGRVGEATRLAELIMARHLSTYTATGCASACVIAFLAGQDRLVNKNAQLGFHQPAFPGLSPSDLQSEYDKEKRFFMSRGVPRAFVEKAFATPNTELWQPSYGELIDANIVTAKAQSGQVGLSGIRPDQFGDMEKGVLRVPLYAALRDYEPDVYHQVMETMKTGFMKGISQERLTGQVRPLLQAAYLRRLPHASDEALHGFAHLMLGQMKVLYEADPKLCSAFIFGLEGAANATAHLTEDLKREELATMADIIRSAARENNHVPTAKEVAESLAQTLALTRKDVGDDISMIGNPAAATDQKRLCEVTYVLYKHIYELPMDKSGPLLRFMFGNG